MGGIQAKEFISLIRKSVRKDTTVIERRMHRCLLTLLLLFIGTGTGAAQTVQVMPNELTRVPVSGLGSGHYWQQLVISLNQDDPASPAAVVVNLPPGIVVADTDGDGRVEDDIRVVYAAVGSENPFFSISLDSSPERIVVSSVLPAAAGGKIYLQFPVVITASPILSIVRYGSINFAEEEEEDVGEGPPLTLVSEEEFRALASIDIVGLGPALAPGPDTTTTALGTVFPEDPVLLVQSLPDLVFDGGVGSMSNLLPTVIPGVGDGRDDNDTPYRFFWATEPLLLTVDTDAALEARIVVGDEEEAYVESEGGERTLRLLTRDLPAGTYYLYVTSTLTGGIPLARSRALTVLHEPVIQMVGPEDDITLDSGRLVDVDGQVRGRGKESTLIEYGVVDHDDSVVVHLFYSEEGSLDETAIRIGESGVSSLEGAQPISGAEGMPEQEGSYTWNVLDPQLVPVGDYYIYAATSDGKSHALRRSDAQVRVRHSPFLRLDALDDGVLTGADTIDTGGVRPQRFVTFTWGRSGVDGDDDVDDDARISLYYSMLPAATAENSGGWSLPGGAEEFLNGLGSEVHPIAADIAEDPDQREENQHVWDLWEPAREGRAVPDTGQVYYVYGIIEDDDSRRLVQMNGGRPNDAGARLIFVHQPALRILQPVADITLEPGRSGRVAWEDMDMDDDARIRVILSSEDYGDISDYATVMSGTAIVVNAGDDPPGPEVDPENDLSEDSPVDHLDIRVEEAGVGNGSYFLYLAITDKESFDEQNMAWRAPGKVEIQGLDEAEAPDKNIQVLPEVFSMGTGGMRQEFEVRIDDGGESVDLVLVSLIVEETVFDVVDLDEELVGIQPFAVGDDFSAAKLITNQATAFGDGTIQLSLGYFEPTAAGIGNLDGEQILATFELVSLDQEGTATIDLEAGIGEGVVSRLERDGQPLIVPEGGPISRGELVPGRAVLRGQMLLEGRSDMSALVDISFRPWASYASVEDTVFAQANDADPDKEGVQMPLLEDGSFELQQVPLGRLDLYVHLDGYLDGWAKGLEFFPNQTLENVRPGSIGEGRLLGGDVAGYTDVDGQILPDNEVTLVDWDYVAAFFGREVDPADGSNQADISGDDLVDIQDLSLVGANYLGRGPRPVYKALPMSERTVLLSLSALRQEVDAGQEVELAVSGEGLAGIRAFELELLYDIDQWVLVEENIGDEAGPVLSAHRAHEEGWRMAASLIGRERDFSRVKRLVTWRLRALRAEVDQPLLRPLLALDQRDQAVPVQLSNSEVLDRLPRGFALEQNFPNPFNPQTTIPFVVPEVSGMPESLVRLELFGVLGQRVRVLWDGMLTAGEHRMAWDGRDQEGNLLSSGIYLYRLRVGVNEQVKRMVLIR